MKKTKIQIEGLYPSATFIPGEAFSEHIGHYINCSNDPYNLNDPADIIVGAAIEMKNREPEKPLVIIMGEKHNIPSHVILRRMVISKLLERKQSLTVARERAYNFLPVFLMASGEKIPDELYYNPYKYDIDGKAQLATDIGYFSGRSAPLSHTALDRFLYERRIPAIFNDVAIKTVGKRGYIDVEDSRTARVVNAYCKERRIKGLPDTDTVSPDSINIRNIFMASFGMKLMAKRKKHLLLQSIGLGHVFGHAVEYSPLIHAPYEFSLTQEYRKAGASVLPVFITVKEQEQGLNALSKEAHKELPDSVVIDGLIEKCFSYENPKGDEQSQTEEKAFIQRLYDASAMGLDASNLELTSHKLREIAEKEIRKFYDQYHNATQKRIFGIRIPSLPSLKWF